MTKVVIGTVSRNSIQLLSREFYIFSYIYAKCKQEVIHMEPILIGLGLAAYFTVVFMGLHYNVFEDLKNEFNNL
jgi:hypothetical protein